MKNHTNLRVADTNTAPQPRPMASPARAKLAELLGQGAQHEKRIREHRAAADRLDGPIEAPKTARAATGTVMKPGR
jgi:hypothetical protein